MYDKTQLKRIQLRKSKDDICCPYYLDVIYEAENEKGVYELHIPHIEIPLQIDRIPTIHVENNGFMSDTCCIEWLDSRMHTRMDNTKHDVKGFYSLKTLKEKRQEMTLEEVEKKLGYKIKLVTKKEEE